MTEELLETADFVDRLRQGDNDAWNLAHRELFRVARNAVRKKFDSSNTTEIDIIAYDVVSEFTGNFLDLEKIHKNHNSEAGFDDMKRMTAGLAIRRTIDHLRKQKRRANREDSLDGIAISVKDVIFESVVMSRISPCINQLPETLREMFLQKWVIGNDNGEIASNCGVNYNTTCTYLARALSLVKECLIKKGVQLKPRHE